MNIYNVIILDESGSMSAIYNQALAGINEVLSGIRKTQEDFPDQHHYVTIVTFEGSGMAGIKTRRDLDARGCHIQSIAQRIHQMVNALFNFGISFSAGDPVRPALAPGFGTKCIILIIMYL